MADALQAPRVAASPLLMRVSIEFFAAMKRIAFDPLVQDEPADQRNIVHFFTRTMPMLHLKANWSIAFDPSIEPSHPHWFAEGMSGLAILKHKSANHFSVEGRGIRLLVTCDMKKETTEEDVRTVFGPISEADPLLYCETNSTTQLMVRVNLDQGRRRRTLEKIKKLAMLVLAFEEEIDKMLADHVGYINENVMPPHPQRRNQNLPQLTHHPGFRPFQRQQHHPRRPRPEAKAPAHLVRHLPPRNHQLDVPRRPLLRPRGLEPPHRRPPQQPLQIQFPPRHAPLHHPPRIARRVPPTPGHPLRHRDPLLDEIRRRARRLGGYHLGRGFTAFGAFAGCGGSECDGIVLRDGGGGVDGGGFGNGGVVHEEGFC